jgi:adenosine kinase
MKKNIIVSGSLAYDRIMDFPGYFSDHILPEKIHMLSVTFQVNSVKEKFGGTAGNIAYALSLLGENPVISSAIGHDYKRYFDWFAKNGIATDNIKIIEDEFTAGAYITTDKADNQITGFHPGAMKYSSSLDFARFNPKETIVTVSPGNLADMINYPEICKAKGIDYIFDPGQALPMLDGEKLAQAIGGCRILVANDYEIELITGKTGLDKPALLKLAKAIIVTQGEFGSLVSTPVEECHIPAVKPKQAVDPTGCGDAYRGGLLSGLVHCKSLQDSARMGSVCASFCVECYGTQDYTFSKEEFDARLNGI